MGVSIYNGREQPIRTTVKEGDFYINMLTDDWYVFKNGIWTLYFNVLDSNGKHICSYCGTIHDKTNCPNCGGNK